jgi:hypothetical protein
MLVVRTPGTYPAWAKAHPTGTDGGEGLPLKAPGYGIVQGGAEKGLNSKIVSKISPQRLPTPAALADNDG